MGSRLIGCSYCQIDTAGNHERSCPSHPAQKQHKVARDLPHGWQCPVCGAVYAPWVAQCSNSHARHTTASTTGQWTEGTVRDE